MRENAPSKKKKLRDFPSISAIFVALLASSLIACVTGDEDTHAGFFVIERSKELPPSWISLEAGSLHDDDNTLQFIESRRELLDLPLGVKRTQLGALTSSKTALTDKFRAAVLDLAVQRNIALDGSSQELELHLEASTKLIHSRFAKVGDIYFEKIRTDTPIGKAKATEYYNVHVLVHFSKAHISEFFGEFGNRLLASEDYGLNRLGHAVAELAEKPLSH